jgi:pimeloyl-ACP methyl ester carboxylesterase
VQVTAVLVHGNFLGPWSWADVAAGLEESGVATVVADLPSGRSDGPPGDLHADAAAVRALLDQLTPPVVLCGHSYGGAVITEAAAGSHPAVRRLVYLAGAVPDAGESLAALAPEPVTEAPSEAVRVLPDGRIALTPESALAALFHDCSAERARRGVELLRPSNPATGTQPVGAAAWRELPSTYVRCRDDRLPELLSPAFLTADVDVRELPTGHCPNWSVPRDVAELVRAVAATVE